MNVVDTIADKDSNKECAFSEQFQLHVPISDPVN